jgi:haloalkane dehalogenase
MAQRMAQDMALATAQHAAAASAANAAVLGAHEADLRRELVPLYPFAAHTFARTYGHGVTNVHFLDEGPRTDEAVLFLHGNPTWSFAWRGCVAALRGSRRCVAPDMVGCGLSDKPQDFDYTLSEHVATVERLCEHLGLARIHLVLHDWGGAIGMGFARRHPERIASITAMNTAAFLGGRLPRRIALCRLPVVGEFAMRRFGAFERAAIAMAVARAPRLYGLVARGYMGPYHDHASRIAVARFVQDIPLAPGDRAYAELAATEAALGQFAHLPVQLIWGERDFCFTPRFRAVWQRHFPAARVHAIPDAGHYVFEDAGAEVEGVLTRFLEDVARG